MVKPSVCMPALSTNYCCCASVEDDAAGGAGGVDGTALEVEPLVSVAAGVAWSLFFFGWVFFSSLSRVFCPVFTGAGFFFFVLAAVAPFKPSGADSIWRVAVSVGANGTGLALSCLDFLLLPELFWCF